jgi:NAD(P)-dependent dehydrogenase (short-subunit alcohol dehydrogenase family)
MRHILVTGASGGLGANLCGLLAASGDVVFATDVLAGALPSESGTPGLVRLRMDVSSAREVARARKRVELLTDGLDGLICCAGIFRAGALVETDEAQMERSLEVNVMGAFRVVRAFFPLLAKRRGTVVLIGTEMSRCAMPFTGPYAVSKAALQAFADALRRELMFLGMHVVVVQPGAIRTPLLSGARAQAVTGSAPTLFPEARDVIRRLLAREWEKGMEPSEVARVVVRSLRTRRPRSVCRVGNDPFRAMLAKLPARWVDAVLRAYLAGEACRARRRQPRDGGRPSAARA